MGFCIVLLLANKRLDFRWHMWQLSAPIHHQTIYYVMNGIHYTSIQFSMHIIFWIHWMLNAQTNITFCCLSHNTNKQLFNSENIHIAYSYIYILTHNRIAVAEMQKKSSSVCCVIQQRAIWLSGHIHFIFSVFFLSLVFSCGPRFSFCIRSTYECTCIFISYIWIWICIFEWRES